MHLPIGSVGGLGQGLEEFLPVHIVVVNALSPVSAARHVMKRPRIIQGQLTRHKNLYAPRYRNNKGEYLLYMA
jgi:hypothetical protein